MTFLIGNAFPMTLVRRAVAITPIDVGDLRDSLTDAKIVSFWGHDNSLVAASKFVGRDLTPKTNRPVVTLNSTGFPTLDGREFREVYIISPNYDSTVRPGLEKEESMTNIIGWTILKLSFK
jgi:hypothetical protein